MYLKEIEYEIKIKIAFNCKYCKDIWVSDFFYTMFNDTYKGQNSRRIGFFKININGKPTEYEVYEFTYQFLELNKLDKLITLINNSFKTDLKSYIEDIYLDIIPKIKKIVLKYDEGESQQKEKYLIRELKMYIYKSKLNNANKEIEKKLLDKINFECV